MKGVIVEIYLYGVVAGTLFFWGMEFRLRNPELFWDLVHGVGAGVMWPVLVFMFLILNLYRAIQVIDEKIVSLIVRVVNRWRK